MTAISSGYWCIECRTCQVSFHLSSSSPDCIFYKAIFHFPDYITVSFPHCCMFWFLHRMSVLSAKTKLNLMVRFLKTAANTTNSKEVKEERLMLKNMKALKFNILKQKVSLKWITHLFMPSVKFTSIPS